MKEYFRVQILLPNGLYCDILGLDLNNLLNGFNNLYFFFDFDSLGLFPLIFQQERIFFNNILYSIVFLHHLLMMSVALG